MDEYLFITMAKLKADRLRLEREQAQRTGEVDRHAADRGSTAEANQRAHWPFAESADRRWTLTSR